MTRRHEAAPAFDQAEAHDARGRAVRVDMLSRPACHLCDRARDVLVAVCDELGVGWVEEDVDSDPGVRARYGDQVPVVFVDGRQHAYYVVEPERLRSTLCNGSQGLR